MATYQSFADVSHRVVNGNQMKVKVLLKQHRVSPDMVHAIRIGPAPTEVTKEDVSDESESVRSEDANGDSGSRSSET